MSARFITGDVQNTTIFKKYNPPLQLPANNTITVDLGSDIDITDYDALTGIGDVRLNNADRVPFAIDVPSLAVGGANHNPNTSTTKSIALLTSSAESATTRVYVWRSSDGRYIYFRDRDDNAEMHVIMGIKYPGNVTSGGGSGGTPTTTTRTEYIYRTSTSNSLSAPSGGTTTPNHVPSGWLSSIPSATSTLNVFRSSRTVTFSNGSFQSATAWGTPTIYESKTSGGTTTRSQTFYRRGTSTPSRPSNSITTGTPAGWLAGNPGATSTQGVYSVTRTQTLTNGVVTSASYGSVTLAEPASGSGSTASVSASHSFRPGVVRITGTISGAQSGDTFFMWVFWQSRREPNGAWTEWQDWLATRPNTVSGYHDVDVSGFSPDTYEGQYEVVIRPVGSSSASDEIRSVRQTVRFTI